MDRPRFLSTPAAGDADAELRTKDSSPEPGDPANAARSRSEEPIPGERSLYCR